MFESRWSQQRIRTEEGKTTQTALIMTGVPSVATVVGARIPRASMLRKNSIQAAADSLLPTARCKRCLRPSESIDQATRRASLAPWRRSDSKMASVRYSAEISERSRATKAS